MDGVSVVRGQAGLPPFEVAWLSDVSHAFGKSRRGWLKLCWICVCLLARTLHASYDFMTVF